VKRSIVVVGLAALGFIVPATARGQAPDSNGLQTTLRISSNAVLVDVLVTDHKGKPVAGLKQDAFTVTDQGKPQNISFFEEHRSTVLAMPPEMPKLPLDVFSNFSPFPPPPAVSVLLLDSLNTGIENQSFVHKQAVNFLKTVKPGSRMAIFTMALGLHFVQGFTDDPALLAAALDKKSNNEVQSSVMLKGQEETNAQQNLVGLMSAPEGNGATAASPAMIAALTNFIQENDDSRSADRVLITLQNMQRLAQFLNGFPGRKNVIWFSESPLLPEKVDPQVEAIYQKTMNMLAAARVALYPVDARGVSSPGFYQASSVLNPSVSQPGQVIGGSGAQASSILAEDEERNSDQESMKRIAHDTGGKAFVNTNGLQEVMADITSSDSDFYTLSYSPADVKMDGTFRKIDVQVAGGKYNLSFRRGYFALDADLPGAAMATRNQAVQKLAAANPDAVDPLLPFMDLGMPQSEQILFEALIHPLPAKTEAGANKGGVAPVSASPAAKGAQNSYSVDFAVDLKDLRLTRYTDGSHRGTLNVSLIAYDRYGRIAGRKDQIVTLNLKPDTYDLFGKAGVQIHEEIEVPAKGQFWLRTGIFDQASHKVGTLEIPLSSVKAPADAAQR
jgi:VWFA-related protein